MIHSGAFVTGAIVLRNGWCRANCGSYALAGAQSLARSRTWRRPERIRTPDSIFVTGLADHSAFYFVSTVRT